MRYKVCLMLTLILAYGSRSQGQELPSSNAPLSSDEVREAALRAEQLILAWRAEDLLSKGLAQQQELSEREKELAARELESEKKFSERELTDEKKRTELAQRETALEKTRADFYMDAFSKVTQKRGFWCGVKKIFTLGLGAC